MGPDKKKVSTPKALVLISDIVEQLRCVTFIVKYEKAYESIARLVGRFSGKVFATRKESKMYRSGSDKHYLKTQRKL